MFRFCSTFRGTAILEPGWPHDPGFSRWTFIRRGRRNVRVIRPLKGSCLGDSWRAQNMDKTGNSNWYLPQSSTYNRIAMYNLLVVLENLQEMAWKSCNWSSVIHFPGKHQETQLDVKGQFCSDGLSVLKDIINSNDSVIQLNGLANSATRKLEEDRDKN